jgi:hypothetical protein
MELKQAKICDFYNITFGTEQGNESAIVKIPHYQRPYRWPPEYINTLINDWDKEQCGKYFAGSIVTVKRDSGIEHQIIDGQQRYTTVFLVNFICFLYVRTAIREAILLNRKSRINSLLDSYKVCSQFLFSEFDIKKHEVFVESVLCKIDELDEAGDAKAEEELQGELLDACTNNLLFPKENEGNPEYLYEYKKLLEAAFNQNNIKLIYDRSSFNENLKYALINSVIKMNNQNVPSFEFVQESDNPVIKQYQQSIKTIFDNFSNLSVGSEPITKAISSIKEITRFLKEVNFCVIQTGSVNDAYTLFEVLNDRALSLDDLDLIKNQFYKKFCLSNSELSEKLIDEQIEKRETQWGDKIFPDGLKLAHKPLITYIFSSFYSGEVDFLFQSNGIYRTKINNSLDKLTSYSSVDFNTDFNVFEASTKFVNSFDLWHKSKNKKALKAEYSLETTSANKLVHLLSALGQFGVLVGFSNTVLKYIQESVSTTFEPELVQNFLDELIKDSDKHKELHSLAERIWILTIQAKNAERPREYAVKLIKENHFRSSCPVGYIDTDFMTTTLKSEFTNWLDNWRYSKNDVKICILFARLIKLSVSDTGGLEVKKFSLSLNDSDVERLHLDHMEPSIVPEHNKEKYFEDEERTVIVNGLGNMFPLHGNLNISKSNQPFIEAFKYIEKSGLGEHWLVKETRDLFDSYNEKNVPKIEFFQRRKALLKDNFYKALNLK